MSTLAGFGLWSGVLSIPFETKFNNVRTLEQTFVKGILRFYQDLLLGETTLQSQVVLKKDVLRSRMSRVPGLEELTLTQRSYGVKKKLPKQQNLGNVHRRTFHLRSKKPGLSSPLTKAQSQNSVLTREDLPASHSASSLPWLSNGFSCLLLHLYNSISLGIVLRLDFEPVSSQISKF